MNVYRVGPCQWRLARLIREPGQIITRDEVGCHEESWRYIRAEASLSRVTASAYMATNDSVAWAVAVEEHKMIQQRMRAQNPYDFMKRKLQRARKAGLLPEPPTHPEPRK